MIALLKRLVLKDMWLKLFSLALAALIWSTVSLAIRKEGPPARSSFQMDKATFFGVPVEVQISASDMHNFRVEPKTVDVTVEGDSDLLNSLQSKDIRATVDLRGTEAGTDLTKRIEVSTPAGLSNVQVNPSEVKIIFSKSQ
jgi:YbbR domain-containing protein